MSETWPPDEWPDMSDEVLGLRMRWWGSLTDAQAEQVIHRGWTIHNAVGAEALNETSRAAHPEVDHE